MAEVRPDIIMGFDRSSIYDPNADAAKKLQLEQMRNQNQKAEFERQTQPYQLEKLKAEKQINDLKVLSQKNDMALGMLQAAQNPNQYGSVRQKILELGLATPEEIPEQYDSNWVFNARKAHMSMKDQLDNEYKNKELDAKRTYYNALEKNADANARKVDIKENEQKPLPVGALKEQQSALTDLQTAKAIDVDLGAYEKQLDEGKLDLGLLKNLASRGRNIVGMSTPESRNLASFKASLEKLRNDSLRLNKGVQTEGDSVRAWNELLENINDPEVVKQRLGEIRSINKRAVQFKKDYIGALRNNYGLENLDYLPYENIQSVPSGGKSDVSKGSSDIKAMSDEQLKKALGL